MSGKIISPEALYRKGISHTDSGEYREAFACFKKAAKQGHADACYRLGMLHLDINEAERDWEAVEYWLLRAADLGVPEADYRLALIYYHDKGTEKTRNRAVGELYEDALRRAGHAAKNNVEDAEDLEAQIRNDLNDMQPEWYWGSEVDEGEVAAFERAAFDGNVYAAWELMRIYGCYPGHEMDGALRVERLLPLCRRGYTEAQRTLAQMYERGDGVPRDMEQAVYWYRQSAELGYAEAQCDLADLYYEGEDVERDFAEAFRLYSLAAEKRHDFAELGLGRMYEEGSGVEQDIAAAVYWYSRAAECRLVTMAAALDKLNELQNAFPEEYDRGWDRYCE